MSYIGNTVENQNYVPAIDYFNGDGATVAFTLSRPVASVAAVQAVISNVPQNPGSAFTVSGSTITFTSAPPSGTNNIYVYYTSPNTQVVQPGQGTVGTTQLQSDLTLTNPTYTGTLTGGTGVVNIGSGQIYKDSSGNVGIGTSSPYSGAGVKTLQLTSSDYSIFEQSVTTATAGYQNWRQIVRGSVGGHVYQLQLMNDANSAEQTIYEVSRTANSVAYQRWYAGTSEAMRIDSSGNVGIGTSSPAKKLDVTGTGRVTGEMTFGNDVVLTNDAYVYSSNGGGVRSGFLLDGTNAATRFYTAGTERMRITSGGDVYINGTGIPIGDARLGVLTTGNTFGGFFQSSVSGGAVLGLNTTGASYLQYFYSSGANVGSITTNGSTTSYNTSSDYRLKENVQPMQNALATIAQLNPVTYTWKSTGIEDNGFIAHELQEVLPNAVNGEKDAVDEEGKPVYQGIDTSFLVATLTKAIQELKAEVDDLKAQLEAK